MSVHTAEGRVPGALVQAGGPPLPNSGHPRERATASPQRVDTAADVSETQSL